MSRVLHNFPSYATLIENQLPGDVTISRLTPPKRRFKDAKRSLPGKTGKDVMFPNTPIENIVRSRQQLRASISAPSLAPPSSPRRATLLPRICTQKEFAPSPAPGESLGTSWLSQEPPGDAWVDVLRGRRQMELPFDQQHDDIQETDSYVHWYRSCESVAHHRPDQRYLADPDFRAPIVPWLADGAMMRAAARQGDSDTGQGLRAQRRAELFMHLAKRRPAKGTEALAEALVFKLGGFEESYRALDLNGTGNLSLMEFVGCLSILGLDTQMLCGTDNRNVFKTLTNGFDTGYVEVKNIIRRYPGARKMIANLKLGSPQENGVRDVPKFYPDSESSETQSAYLKWIAVAKWMAAAQQRSHAIKSERMRNGWHTRDEAAEGAAASASAAAADPKEDSSSLPCARTGAEVAKESGVAMREQEFAIRGPFARGCCVTLPDGSRLMSKSDLYKFFCDLNLADAKRHKLLHPELLDRLYDEAIDLQCGLTKIGTGLTFWSFKVVLNNAIVYLGFKWDTLVDRTLHVAQGLA